MSEDKLQYTLFEGPSFLWHITRYKNGLVIDTVKKWFRDELDAYLEDIESQGYFQAYFHEDVQKAKDRYEYLLTNELVNPLEVPNND